MPAGFEDGTSRKKVFGSSSFCDRNLRKEKTYTEKHPWHRVRSLAMDDTAANTFADQQHPLTT
jgi:hypothetical protein